MNDEDRIADLQDRTHRLDLLDELDRQGAKAERESRVARKQEIDAERKTIRVSEDERGCRLVEYPMSDPIKWNAIIHSGLIYRINDAWYVRTDIAEAQGYVLVEA